MGLKFSLKQDGGMWRVKDWGRAKRDYPEPSLATSIDTAHVVWLIGETMSSFRGCRWLGALQKRDIMAFYDSVVERFGAYVQKGLCWGYCCCIKYQWKLHLCCYESNHHRKWMGSIKSSKIVFQAATNSIQFISEQQAWVSERIVLIERNMEEPWAVCRSRCAKDVTKTTGTSEVLRRASSKQGSLAGRRVCSSPHELVYRAFNITTPLSLEISFSKEEKQPVCATAF